ncbi:hypothetical protein DICPUDRAFT_76954 [Dictyostelium purpureum]|uniref:Methyltransferase domain-containing protein n=1 Tax=Dictyostelium purpureum TaxID=5786 RepID=F0ZF60_DICPU|nr:uncharacterized protein DICPUDRAFT_76954 [Dictyostelium purpureum]EGC37396.1 hypothetical protein DICPUDRAFT_76954 [Dictyostelium purpureum]|eukprot:XP_003286049.1 hypothetical protein DICPUDRAFT_76954 [Dictyostelium purpureum]
MENYNINSNHQLSSMLRNMENIHTIIQSPIDNHNNEQNKGSFKILDIGSSHGRNSIIFLNSILSKIKPQINDGTIEVYHCDLEINDFSKLFLEINKNENSYKNKWNKTFCYAIGNTYKNQLMSDGSCDIIFSYHCFHWCSYEDTLLSGADTLVRIKESSLCPKVKEFNIDHLSTILSHRNNELKKGGIFICNLLIFEKENEITYSIESTFTNIKNILREMANENKLSHREVDNIFVPFTFFKKDEVDIVVKEVGSRGLKLIHSEKTYETWEQNEKFVDSVLSIISHSIKRPLEGDEEKINSIFEEFIKRFKISYKLNPELYCLYMCFKLLIFKKE